MKLETLKTLISKELSPAQQESIHDALETVYKKIEENRARVQGPEYRVRGNMLLVQSSTGEEFETRNYAEAAAFVQKSLGTLIVYLSRFRGKAEFRKGRELITITKLKREEEDHGPVYVYFLDFSDKDIHGIFAEKPAALLCGMTPQGFKKAMTQGDGVWQHKKEMRVAERVEMTPLFEGRIETKLPEKELRRIKTYEPELLKAWKEHEEKAKLSGGGGR